MAGTDSLSASRRDRDRCPISSHVKGHASGGPIGNNDWYANANRTNLRLRFGDGTLCVVGQVNLIQGRATNRVNKHCGTSPPLGYDISRDSRPRGPIQPSGIDFPTAGCWEIEARAGCEELRVVDLVKPGPPTFE